jgi:hypothetical protein
MKKPSGRNYSERHRRGFGCCRKKIFRWGMLHPLNARCRQGIAKGPGHPEPPFGKNPIYAEGNRGY